MREENRLLFGYDEEIAKWVAERTVDGPSSFGKCASIGVLNPAGDRMLAGMVYSQYKPEYSTIQASIASVSPLWATRGTIRALLHYPFMQLGCYKVWACVNIKNTRCCKCLEHIGFKREATLAHHLGKGNHALIYRLLKPEYVRNFLDGQG
jgi:RimJ/RimL family protein N-acetyltransferase